MIKGENSLDGIPIKNLSLHSHKSVIKICDFCGKESTVAIREIYKSRKRTSHGKDACKKCSNKVSGELRRKGNILIGDGYLAYYNDEGKRNVLHRKIMEEYIGRKLEKHEVVHHIDGDKINNNIDNLFLCFGDSEHRHLHSSLEMVGMELVKRGIIGFDKNNRLYFLKQNESLFDVSLGFESIGIKQKKNKCKSRLDVNTESEIIRGVTVNIPLIASNMSTVIDSDFYLKLVRAGAFGFLHRALIEDDYVMETLKIAKEYNWVPVSIGIGQDQYELADRLIHYGANIILIDIAHGYSDEVIELGKKLKKNFPHIKLVLGNTTNTEMIYEVSDFADALKIGIAQGFACETKNTAGCTEKQFSCVLKFKELSKKLGLPIISDGGTREPADFVKAVGAGANSVMAGSIFASCEESAAELIDTDDGPKKVYAGMASEYVQNQWKGGLKPGTCAEGGIRLLNPGPPVKKLLETYNGALKSGITYGGGTDIKSFQKEVEFIKLI